MLDKSIQHRRDAKLRIPPSGGSDGERTGRPKCRRDPTGWSLSPLLSNVVLDALDRELERRGLRFVRYADDCDI
ncbi:MAG: hypothetical protein JO108_05750 [Acidobacteriaceae bacterium]|nr:hypothetical protein [Acidobacteriaceae bacterium]